MSWPRFFLKLRKNVQGLNSDRSRGRSGCMQWPISSAMLGLYFALPILMMRERWRSGRMHSR